VPIDQPCFIRVRVILLRGEGQPVFRPYHAKAVYSSGDCGDPEPPFGKGSPAAMLVLAAGACHAAELGAALDLAALPWNLIEVQTDATCAAVPSAACLDMLAVYPIIYGADPSKRSQYAAASKEARDRSLIGRTIRGNVAYKLGAVTVVADDAPGGGDTETADAFPDALASCHLAAFNGHRHDQLIATLHPDCTLEDVALGHLLRGQAVVADYYRSWWEAFGLVVTNAQCRRSDAELMTVEAHCIGTHRGAFRAIAPTHRKVDLRVAAVLRFRDGLMADARIYYDATSLHHQLGIATCAP
jgi:steroid delta-isomerase-like uncharacterized protein